MSFASIPPSDTWINRRLPSLRPLRAVISVMTNGEAVTIPESDRTPRKAAPTVRISHPPTERARPRRKRQ